MARISDYYFDLALAGMNDGTRMDLCSQEPTTFTEATVTYTLGNKTGITIGAPEDRSPNGRKVVVPAISDGTATASATATHYAITDPSNSRLVATGALSQSKPVATGIPWTSTAFDLGIADAT